MFSEYRIHGTHYAEDENKHFMPTNNEHRVFGVLCLILFRNRGQSRKLSGTFSTVAYTKSSRNYLKESSSSHTILPPQIFCA
jgi:hypothetical protein